MKIRIQGNSVRYRLTRSEVATLKQDGYYKEQDFVCLDERTEDQSDNYPNPAATTKK